MQETQWCILSPDLFYPQVLVTFQWGHHLFCDYLHSQWPWGDDNLQLNLWTWVHHNYRHAKSCTAASVIMNKISNAFIQIATTLLWFTQCWGCSAAALLPMLHLLWFYHNLTMFCVFMKPMPLEDCTKICALVSFFTQDFSFPGYREESGTLILLCFRARAVKKKPKCFVFNLLKMVCDL